MITRNGNTVKLIDFGLTDVDSSVVMKGAAGTRGYADPEQDDQSNALNDIYSLGLILNQLQLGLAYHGVCSKCCRPQRRRYQNVEAVREAMCRAYLLPKIFFLLTSVIILAKAVTFHCGKLWAIMVCNTTPCLGTIAGNINCKSCSQHHELYAIFLSRHITHR